MPLPQGHRESLQEHLSVHEERLAQLQKLQDAIKGDAPDQQGRTPTSGARTESDAGGKKGAARHDKFRKTRRPEWLNEQREKLAREIRIHERLLELGKDPKVMDALGELAKNRKYAQSVAQDPERAARERGIELPPNMRLQLSLQPDSVVLQIAYYEDVFPFVITWRSESGFSSALTLEREAHVRPGRASA
jgi:hypothetical protein